MANALLADDADNKAPMDASTAALFAYIDACD